ncbi:MAG: single-stranded-DNA-specific exonuclease RecJ, partial [Muribaculaceae bacterium]|nr:single-stranded-DNA-specific exonuclease RecJ [Muribaculaceae bacterium]
MNSKWNYKPLTTQEKRADAELAKRYSAVPPVSELLAKRGIESIDEAERFFHPSLSNMHDPFMMPDMDKAVARLNKAMGAKEKIMVYGDYDVDGTT